MSYQVLARKWRPRDFTTLVGQEHVVRALTHALEQQRLHHAYLFTGTRGVGKTTLSRILAKALNCTGPDGNGGITAQPCGQCKACQEIDSGRFVDYIEMDAASNRGVDEMAQLLDKAVYAPTSGRFKVYMIDEVHMLTNHAFNAMLKTLEEPPGHVKFILATTDPQKIPVTVLSRCLQFNLKQMPPGHIVSHLDHILAQEGIGHDGNALRLLAQAAHGSMRDALSLTDQAIAYSAGQVSEDAVRGMLGAIDQGYLVQLLDALAAEDGAAMLAIADAMADRSLSFAGALQDLGSLLHKVALAQAVPASVQDEWPEADEVRRLAGVFDAQEVQLFYQIANLGRNELALAPDEYAGFTMTLLRMLAFRPSSEPTTAQGQGGGAAPARQRGAEAAQTVDTRHATAVANAAEQAKAGAAAAPVPAPMPARAVQPVAVAEPAAAPAAVPASPEAAPARPAARQAEPESVPPWELAGGSDVPPWEELPPDLPVIGPYDSDPGYRDNGFNEPAARAAGPRRAPAREAEPARETAPVQPAAAPAESAKFVAPRPPAAGEDGTPPAFTGEWPVLAAGLPLKGLAQQLAYQSELTQVVGRTFHLRIPVAALGENGVSERLQQALCDHFGEPVRVVCEVGGVSITAAAADAEARAERQRQAEAVIEADPFVQGLLRDFGGQIVPGSIQPRAA